MNKDVSQSEKRLENNLTGSKCDLGVFEMAVLSNVYRQYRNILYHSLGHRGHAETVLAQIKDFETTLKLKGAITL